MNAYAKPTQTSANDLVTDDFFKLGGAMYRVLSKSTNDYGETVLEFYPVEGAPRSIATLIIYSDTQIERFNQK